MWSSLFLLSIVAMHESRKYELIYRGPGFLEEVWLGSSPTPSPHQQVSLSQSSCVLPWSGLYWGERRGLGDGRGAKSYDKAWSSIKSSTLSGYVYLLSISRELGVNLLLRINWRKGAVPQKQSTCKYGDRWHVWLEPNKFYLPSRRLGGGGGTQHPEDKIRRGKVCPIVGIGSPPPPRKASVAPPRTRGGDKLYVYYNSSTIQ